MGLLMQDGTALVWRGGQETVRVEPWGRGSLRVRGTLWQAIRDDLPGALLNQPETAAEIEITGSLGRISNGGLTAEMSASGQLRFLGSVGQELLAETTPHFTGPPTRRYRPVGGGMHHFEVQFNAYDAERFYGLGQHQHGRLNQKGAVVELVQRNTEVNIPFLVSSRGYGLLWNHPGIGRVELGTTLTRWVSEATRQWDYWITAADDPAALLRAYTPRSPAGHRCCRPGRPVTSV
jgi:alpha-D-xyloside xylohydrolase